MLQKLLLNTEWKQLTSFVSPAFFEVLSVREMLARGRVLLVSTSDQTYRRAVVERGRTLAGLPLGIRLDGTESDPPDDLLGDDASARARRIVTLYFHQLYSDSPTLLDLRASAFGSQDAGPLSWSPKPWVCAWESQFLANLRDVYAGFYADDDTRFGRGLDGLNIRVAEDLFRKHFATERSDHRFVMSDFVRTFHDVFVRCREEGKQLQVEFLPLGIYLASLYDALDGADVSVDVGACHAAAREHITAEWAGAARA